MNHIQDRDNGHHTIPAVLLPYQQRWIEDDSPLKVIEKSRRTGLTWGEAADDVLTAAADRTAGGQNVYYIAYNQDMTVEYIQACAMWARAFNRAAGEIEEGFWEDDEADKHIKTFTIRFPESGFRIVALTSRPSNLRGRQGVIVIDEAAFHEQLYELLKAALAMLIWGGKVRVISTHNGDENPFNELINDIRAGKRKGTVQRITFKEAVAEGLYRRVCLRLGKPWTAEDEAAWMQGVYDFYGAGAEEELDCIPSNGSGAYLSRALIESRMNPATPVLRFSCEKGFETLPDHIREAEARDWCERELKPLLAKLDPSTRSYYGMDFGRSGDLSVLWPLLEDQGLVRRVPFLVELRNVPFRQQEQILFYIVDRLPRFMAGAMDARGNGQYLAEVAMQRYGSTRIEQVMLTEGWYEFSVKSTTQMEETRCGARYYDISPSRRGYAFSLDWLDQAEAYGRSFELMREADIHGEILLIPNADDSINLYRTAFYATLAKLNPIRHPNLAQCQHAYELEEIL